MSTLDSIVHKGLAGVVADTTAISMVNDATNSLTYRGYPVQQLAASCSFEQVAYLIWHGELPNTDELASFTAEERAVRAVPCDLMPLLDALPATCHPMDVLRTAVSILGAADVGASDNYTRALRMMAVLPSVVAAIQRRRHGLHPIPADPTLGFAENYLHMCFGVVPAPAVVRCFEVSLILYAEHSFNASTFTARIVTSTLSDIYSAVTAAIGALKGPLHGGANEAVMAMLLDIGEPENAANWITRALAEKQKIMGFGHRVYKHGDSRVPIMYRALVDLATTTADGKRLLALSDAAAEAMMAAKGIHPNLDFPAGPAYYLMGFDIPLFTPIFVTSRITGWTAHIIEQLSANSLIRPLSRYTGAPERSVPRE